MKKIAFTLLLLSTIMVCCKKEYQGDSYDFSNTLPPYVALSSTDAITVGQDTSINITFSMRTALQQNVTVTYSLTGAINIPDQTVVIARDKTSSDVTVVIPPNVVASPVDTATAILTLAKAVTADGKNLTIGQTNDPHTQKVAINITE